MSTSEAAPVPATKAMEYSPDRPPAGQADATYSSWGFPLFACAWSRSTGKIFLAGGGGVAGFGASSGIYVCQPTQAWRLRQLGSLNSFDQVVDNMCFHPSRPEAICGVNGDAHIMRECLNAPSNGTQANDVRQVPVDIDTKDGEALMTCAQFGADGALLVTGGHDQTVRIWKYDVEGEFKDKPNLSLVKTFADGHKQDIKCVDFNGSQSLIASASAEATCVVWDAASGERKHTLTVSHPSTKQSLNFRFCRFVNPKVKSAQSSVADIPEVLITLANQGSRGASALQIWNATTFKLISNIALDAAPVCAAQLNHDQSMFAFATNRSTIFVFDTVLRKFSAKHVLVHDLPVTGLAFSPDSQRVLSVSADRTSRISLTRKPSDSKAGFILMVLLLLVLALVALAFAVHHRSFDVSVLPPNAVHWIDQQVEHVLDFVQRLQSDID